jgi:hypothetical protein
VRQKQNSNATNVWEEGPLNELNLTVYDAPNVGLQACWYGNYYGDTDAANFHIHGRKFQGHGTRTEGHAHECYGCGGSERRHKLIRLLPDEGR